MAALLGLLWGVESFWIILIIITIIIIITIVTTISTISIMIVITMFIVIMINKHVVYLLLLLGAFWGFRVLRGPRVFGFFRASGLVWASGSYDSRPQVFWRAFGFWAVGLWIQGSGRSGLRLLAKKG